MSDTVIISKSGRRQTPRVKAKLTVMMGEHRYEVADWSTSGIGLGERGPELDINQEIEAKIDDLHDGADNPVTFKLKVVRLDEEGFARNFMIVGIDDVDFARLKAAMALELEAPVYSAAAPEFMQSNTYRTRQYLSIGASVLFLSFIVIWLYAASIIVHSTEGRVLVDGVEIRMPENGTLNYVRTFEEGERLKKNEKIAFITSRRIDQDLYALQSEIDLLNSQKVTTEQRLKDVEDEFSTYQNLLELTYLETKKRLGQLQEQERLLSEVVRGRAALEKDKVGSRFQFIEDKTALSNVRIDVANARLSLGQLEIARQLATKGLYAQDSVNERLTVSELRRDYYNINSQLQSRHAEFEHLEEQMIIRSPCDCVLVRQDKADQTNQLAGETIAYLGAQDKGQVYGEVYLPAQEAIYLELGQSGKIYSPVLREPVDATISRIRFEQSSDNPDLPRDFVRVLLQSEALTSDMVNAPIEFVASRTASQFISKWLGL